jgi:uncharacterized protein (DUF2235 family)
MRRLALFMDGTWNDPESETNVCKLYQRVAKRDRDGVEQLSSYVHGVGTNRFERLRGGAFGLGLSRNVLKGYRWLVENYRDGDEIYVFGFSRGAYTARSVVGFMSRCGLLFGRDGSISAERLFERYKNGKKQQAIPGLKEIKDRIVEGNVSGLTDEDLTLAREARRVEVRFIGVWDTVGALGIPTGKIWLPGNRRKYEFHDVELSSLVQNACHAVAIDEHREDYQPSLWTQYVEETAVPREMATIEQRWFAGAHSNVGGGYAKTRLSDLPLAWIAKRSGDLGLELDAQITLDGNEPVEAAVDAFGEFLGGIYGWFKKRHYRPIDAPPVERPGGRNLTINQTIAPSVFERWRAPEVSNGGKEPGPYRPDNLKHWADEKRVDPMQLRSIVQVTNGIGLLDDGTRLA